jgi:TRAP-type transport system periplasmic protein
VNRFFKIVTAIILGCSCIQAQQYTIKFATVAPQGSTWYNVMKEYDDAIRKESGGRMGFKIYPGGTSGEEKDVIRKMRVGQLHSAGFTGVGLGEIAPKVRVLDAPFLFKSYTEVDYVHEMFNQEFEKAFEDGGYINLGWAEVGFVYVFTKTPVKNAQDLKGVKMWMWEGDPIAEAAFKALNVSPIPLSLADVLTSLQTGLVDGMYTSPLAAISLQWFTRVKYALELPLADSHGAVLIAKKEYDKLPQDLQEILVRNGRIYMKKLTELSRQDNQKSLEQLKKSGIIFLSPGTEKDRAGYEQMGKTARQSLVGKLYDQNYLDRIEKAVLDARKQPKGTK